MSETCDNRFIHRRFSRRKEEIQCPLCGKKLTVWSDEDHLKIEAAHAVSCGVRNQRSTPAEEGLFG